MQDQYITITADRHLQLIRAEATAKLLLDVIKERKEN